jgi:hypothetical protein
MIPVRENSEFVIIYQDIYIYQYIYIFPLPWILKVSMRNDIRTNSAGNYGVSRPPHTQKKQKTMEVSGEVSINPIQ